MRNTLFLNLFLMCVTDIKQNERILIMAQEFDNKAYYNENITKSVAGKDLLLTVWNSTGTELLVIGGQQGLTINRSADSIEINSKDTEGGWKSKLAGLKEWGIDTDGLYVNGEEAHKILSKAFEDGDHICLKVINKKTQKGMFGGLAVITDYPIEAPYDDAVTYSLSLEGAGKLVDLTNEPSEHDAMPESIKTKEEQNTQGE